MFNLIAQCETNTLVLGKSGSGKSYQLSTIAKKMLSENKKVYLFFSEEDLRFGNYHVEHRNLIQLLLFISITPSASKISFIGL